MSSFDIEKTIQSQYAASEHIKALVNSFWEALDPEADIDLLYDKVINIDTAEGFGLDVWGRIVAIGRSYLAVDVNRKYFGFEPPSGVNNSRLDNFNNAVFYKQITGKVRLADPAYRTYILIKAMINIGTSSLADLNAMIKTMFPDENIMVLHVDTMVLRLLILSNISEANKQALINLPWLPAGVGLQLYRVVTPTFGFNGSNLESFNNGTFSTFDLTDIS